MTKELLLLRAPYLLILIYSKMRLQDLIIHGTNH